MQTLMRARYLDPDFVLAHFALGNLYLSQSRRREAERHFDNALALLRAHPHDEPLPESEGLDRRSAYGDYYLRAVEPAACDRRGIRRKLHEHPRTNHQLKEKRQ